jgi:predicted phosphoribosyltransferase
VIEDRAEAGRLLAAALQGYRDCPGGLILAVPRGGVVVGREISVLLRLPLDVLLTRKIGAPGNPELAIGALTETGYLYINEELLATYPALARVSERERLEQEREIDRRRMQYRNGRPLPSLEGRPVILVDDGTATGATYLASVHALKASRVGRLIAALPVAPPETARLISRRVDDCVVLETPDPFYAVGQHYVNFRQVDDEEVLRCLAESWRPPKPEPAATETS